MLCIKKLQGKTGELLVFKIQCPIKLESPTIYIIVKLPSQMLLRFLNTNMQEYDAIDNPIWGNHVNLSFSSNTVSLASKIIVNSYLDVRSTLGFIKNEAVLPFPISLVYSTHFRGNVIVYFI